MRKLLGFVVVVICLSLKGHSDVPHKTHSEFTFARVQFTMNPRWVYDYREAPWHHDYPFAQDLYLSVIKEVTGVNTSKDSYEIVQLDSPDIFKYPFLYFPGRLRHVRRFSRALAGQPSTANEESVSGSGDVQA